MSRYIVAGLPRSGSYLITQLLEQYLLKKYPEEYLPAPFYEFFCRGTIDRAKQVKAHYKGSGEVGFTYDSPVNYHTEVQRRLEIIKRMEQDNKTMLFKLMFSINLREVNDKYMDDPSYHKVFIQRKDTTELILSRIVANKFHDWHSHKEGVSTKGQLGVRNSWSDDIPKRSKRSFSITAQQLDPLIRISYKYNKDVGKCLARGDSSVVYYEDIVQDYSRLYESLGLTDWKDYIEDFNFVVSIPCEEPFKDLILNYDQVKNYIENNTEDLHK